MTSLSGRMDGLRVESEDLTRPSDKNVKQNKSENKNYTYNKYTILPKTCSAKCSSSVYNYFMIQVEFYYKQNWVLTITHKTKSLQINHNQLST